MFLGLKVDFCAAYLIQYIQIKFYLHLDIVTCFWVNCYSFCTMSEIIVFLYTAHYVMLFTTEHLTTS